MFLVKDPDSAVFEPRYKLNFRVRAIFGNNRIEVQDEKGHRSVRRSSHVKYIEPSEKIIQQLPSKEVLKNYGRTSKLLIADKDIPNLQFNMEETEENSEPQKYLNEPTEGAEVVEVMETSVLTKTVSGSTVAAANNDYHEHSKNSLTSEAGETLE